MQCRKTNTGVVGIRGLEGNFPRDSAIWLDEMDETPRGCQRRTVFVPIFPGSNTDRSADRVIIGGFEHLFYGTVLKIRIVDLVRCIEQVRSCPRGVVVRQLKMFPFSRSTGGESARSDASNSAPAGYVITDQPSIFAPEIPNGVRCVSPEQKIARRLGKHSWWMRFEINVQGVSRTHPAVELRHVHHPPIFLVKQPLAIDVH